MLIYITAPHNKMPKKIIRRLHPLASCLHLLPRRCRRTHFVCLFLHSFVPLVGCCVVSLPLVVASRLVAASRCCATSRLSSSVSSSSSRRVSSRLVVVSRPLTHLVTPALFDCCVYCRHRAAAATVAVACPRCRRRHAVPCCAVLCRAAAVLLPPPPRRHALSRSHGRSRRSSGSIRRRHRDST